jgi:hypothetical protein
MKVFWCIFGVEAARAPVVQCCFESNPGSAPVYRPTVNAPPDALQIGIRYEIPEMPDRFPIPAFRASLKGGSALHQGGVGSDPESVLDMVKEVRPFNF